MQETGYQKQDREKKTKGISARCTPTEYDLIVGGVPEGWKASDWFIKVLIDSTKRGIQ